MAPQRERGTEGKTYRLLYNLARFAVWSYFRNVEVIGRERVSPEGPLLVAANHMNMVLDPAMLIATFPHSRPCHFWALARFFKLPIAGQLLKGAGVLPVDTKTHSNDKLFEHTIACLEHGGVIALFPEGTSYTAPKHLPFKDGLSWATYEYLTKQPVDSQKPASISIIPVGITYSTKNKWRSDVVVEYGEPIVVSTETAEFRAFANGDDCKNVVKKLTAEVALGVEKCTVNAPDWDTANAASEARLVLFGDSRGIQLKHYVRISQALVELFTLEKGDLPLLMEEERRKLKQQLLKFAKTLRRLHLTSLDISMYEKKQISVTNAAMRLASVCMALVVQLPLFLPGLVINSPIYFFGKMIASFEMYDESVAQDKIAVSALLALPIYGYLTYALFGRLGLSGVLLALMLIPLFTIYHMSLVDKRYDMAKEVIASWRILVAVSGADSNQRSELEDAVELQHWCHTHTKSVLLQLANQGDSNALNLVHYGGSLFGTAT